MGDIYIPPTKPGATPNVSMFGVELRGTTVPLAVGSVGIMLCYCASSLAQEFVYLSGWQHTVFLTLVCKAMAAVWGGMGGGFSHRQAPQKDHAMVGMLSFATMWLSNASLLYLNYPSQTIFKSAKLIPVMLASRIVLRKSYPFLQYVAAICLFLGLVVFTMAEVNVSPKFHFLGVFYITAALLADALIGNYQERMFVSYGPSMHEMLTWSNLYASVGSLLLCVVSGEFVPAIEHLTTHTATIHAILLYGFCNIIGIYFVLVMIYRFGAATTTFVTSLRKAVTVVLSFLLFTKPLSVGYFVGGLLVALGIYLNISASKHNLSAAPAASPSPSSSSSDSSTISTATTSRVTTASTSPSSKRSLVTSAASFVSVSAASKVNSGVIELTSSTNGLAHLHHSTITNPTINNDMKPVPSIIHDTSITVSESDLSRWMEEETDTESVKA